MFLTFVTKNTEMSELFAIKIKTVVIITDRKLIDFIANSVADSYETSIVV